MAKDTSTRDDPLRLDWVVERFEGVVFEGIVDDDLSMSPRNPGAAALIGDASSYAGLIHEDDRAEVRARLRALVAGDEPEPCELDHRLVVEGELRWVRLRAWARRNADGGGAAPGIEGTIVDISERKRLELAEAELQRSRASARAVVMELATHPATDEGAFEVLAKVVSERLCEVCRVDRASVWQLRPGEEDLELIDRFERGRRRHTQGALLTAKDYPVYFEAMRSGRVIDAHLAQRDPRTREFLDDYLAPHGIVSMLDAGIRVGGEIVGVVCLEQMGQPRHWLPHEIDLAAEVADQLTLALHNRSRQEARERERSLQEQLLQSQKMDALGRLAGGIAHDFNNLLFAIGASAEMLQDQLEAPLLRGLAEDILTTSEQAAELTQQLLAFSRRQPLERHDLDLVEVVTGLERMLTRLLGREIMLEVSVPDEPVVIRATESLVQQLLTNLVVNARDAILSNADGGLIDVSVEIAELREPLIIMSTPVEVGRYALLAVADDGCGMKQEVLDKVFEPFFTTKAAGKGTGLGLATVYGIAQRLGGTIKVASEVGIGSRFYVFLPLAADLGPED